jgi:uncharacterized protein YneF (UPF0154 family)
MSRRERDIFIREISNNMQIEQRNPKKKSQNCSKKNPKTISHPFIMMLHLFFERGEKPSYKKIQEV